MQPFRAIPLALLFLGLALAGCIATDGEPGEEPRLADDEEVPAAVNATVAWGDAATAKLRPGSSYGGFCTFNWLFTDGAGNAFVGTAAHCTELGARAELGDGSEIGTVVYDSDQTPGAAAQVDFALILIDASAVADAHPRMLGQDGPTGVATQAMIGDVVAIHGYGMILGEQDLTRDRVGLLVDVDEREYRANMPAVWGDSGSPVIHVETGAALGIVSRFGFLEPPLPSTDVGPRLAWILEELHKAGFEVELATV